MSKQALLKFSSALTVVAVASLSVAHMAKAQTTDAPEPAADKPAEKAVAKPADGSILVLGLRGSLKTAADKKKNAKQIVDSVVAEDVGKLPDNNVVEALARVTGVQIERTHGEGSALTIRGMGNVSTTLNGKESNDGTDRSMDLSDIPSELLKSVEVYKTRTADQIEGGLGGTVNVELRRPLDLRKGLTLAGSIRDVFSSQGNTKSPSASLLVGERMDTAAGGEIGFLINASFSKNNYNETFVESETPGMYWNGGKSYQGLPTAKAATTIVPYAVNYGVEAGSISRPSLNAVVQWRVSPKLDFVLEGTAFSTTERRNRDRLHLVIRDDNNTLTNVVYGKTTASGYNTIQSLTQAPQPGGLVDGGPESYTERVTSRNYNANFEAHYNSDRFHANFNAGYQTGHREYYGLLSVYRLPNATSASVDFNSPNVPGGGPYITFNGVNLGDPSQYSLLNFHDERGLSTNDEYSAQLDLTRDLGTGFFKNIQAGVRYTKRNVEYTYGYRDSFPQIGGKSIGLTSFGGLGYASTSPSYGGAASWYHLSADSLWANLGALKSYVAANNTTGIDWSTQYPILDLGSGYKSKEQTLAFYGQFNYGTKLAGLPVDGTVGLRAVHTWGEANSAQFSYDKNWNPTITQAKPGVGNFWDFLPSVNAAVHFNPKTQLRLAYTQNVQRADFYALSPFAVVQAANSTVYAGNPELKAYTEKNFDVSLEHYFGRGGQLSLAGYYKLPNGYIYYSQATEYVAQLGGNATVFKNRNAGKGTFAGAEFTAQSFFDFLPKKFRNFGASFNATYLAIGKIEFPDNSDNNALGMSHFTYNAALYYEDPKLSTRVSWNYRSRYRAGVLTDYPEYSPYIEATSRLDAAINYTPVKFLTLSLEGSNLLHNNMRQTWGQQSYVPQGTRLQARTIQIGARFRY